MEVPTNPTRQSAFVWICDSFLISANEIRISREDFFGSGTETHGILFTISKKRIHCCVTVTKQVLMNTTKNHCHSWFYLRRVQSVTRLNVPALGAFGVRYEISSPFFSKYFFVYFLCTVVDQYCSVNLLSVSIFCTVLTKDLPF